MNALKLALLLTLLPGFIAWRESGGLAPTRLIVTGSLPRLVMLLALVWAAATAFWPAVGVLCFALAWMGVLSYFSYRNFQHRKASQ